MSSRAIESLLAERPASDVWQQLEWLPSRHPKDPAAMLISAVQSAWGEPARHDPRRAKEVWEAWMGSGDAGPGGHGHETPTTGEPIEASDEAGERDAHAWRLGGCDLDARDVWKRVLDEMRMQMTGAAFDVWLRGSEVLRVEDEGLAISVRDAYAQEWLGSRWSLPIRRTLSGIVGYPLDVRFEVA